MNHISRRRLLKQSALGLMAAPGLASWLTQTSLAADGQRKKILFYNKSEGFEHSVVASKNGAPTYAERMLKDFAGPAGFDFVATKDGSVFEGDLDQYDGFLFFTQGDLTKAGLDKQTPVSEKGKERLLEAVAGGKGFVGSHCASDTFHSAGHKAGQAFVNQQDVDPYIAMIGGEFIRHGRQQKARMKTVDAKFPGADMAGEGFDLNEEWYSLKNFAADMHVILVQETQGMQDKDYDRPPYPATWARMHKRGRVFYSSMGHREDVWTNPIFQALFVGALRWSTGQVEADLSANLKQVTPQANVLPKV
ncbi:MAG: ThuA domain-containing protein [Pirellulaceae bacterium]|nr:ThuA domain-containing protein [Pirellulaceae bacterium]